MAAYGDDVLRVAFLYLGERASAEDVAQETFVRAFRHWRDFRRDSSPKTWLVRIAINLCLSHLSRQKRLGESVPSVILGESALEYPEEAAIERLNRTTVLKRVLALPPVYREVIYLYYYLDLSVREIAEVMGTTEGTVRGRLHRARGILREGLKRDGFADDV